MSYLKQIKNQVAFQNSKKENYFEGWYYKHMTKHNETFILIPGISISNSVKTAFIQIIYNSQSFFIPYSYDEVSYTDDPFMFRIGDTIFTKEGVTVNISDKQINITGNLTYNHITPLKPTKFMPTIMGPFSYLKMQCNHGVVSLHHTVNGEIKINNETLTFNNDNGYIEKDYGTSFPREYIWLQGNEKKDKICSIMVSIAHIPFFPKSFYGFLCTLLIDNKQYFFTSYHLSKLSILECNKNKIKLYFKNKSQQLYITCDHTEGHNLIAPQNGTMNIKMKESISSNIEIQLIENNNVLYKTKLVGCSEIVGNHQKIIKAKTIKN